MIAYKDRVSNLDEDARNAIIRLEETLNATYDKAIELKPDNAEAYINRGVAYKNPR